MKCPACNNGKRLKEIRAFTVMECPKCRAIFSGNCYLYLGESYSYVLPYFAKEEVPPEKLRYYDFMCIGSMGIMRRHGWYDPATKLIHQVG
jgi:hypothetical protein